VNFNIRPMEYDDLKELVQLSLVAWVPVFESFELVLGPTIFALLYPDWRASQRQVVERICGEQEASVVLVAEVEERVAGFIAYELNDESQVGVVHLLAVHPDFQNAGIGTALNNAALQRMQECGMKLAEVGTGGDSGHAAARRCYEKAGYTAMPAVTYLKAL